MTSLPLSLVTSGLTTAQWFWLIAPPCLTAALGFFAGWLFARPSPQRRLHQAQARPARLFSYASESLEHAQLACSALEQTEDIPLSTSQATLLQEKHEGLQGLLTRILQRHGEWTERNRAARAEKALKLAEFGCEWIRDADTPDSLPGRELFEQNLARLMAAGTASGVQSGLLLIRVDRLAQLADRFGAERADLFVQRLSQVVLRAVRNQDLLCRYSPDTLAALLPATETEEGIQLATAVRDSVRHHHFRLEADGPEIFVTASFGFTPCLPTDHPDLTVNRAGDALARSGRRGRNQLHVHDGSQLQPCST